MMQMSIRFLFSSILLLTYACSLSTVSCASVTVENWYQNGGDSLNSGYSDSAKFEDGALFDSNSGITLKAIYETKLQNAVCQENLLSLSIPSALYSSTLLFPCFNYLSSGAQNVTLFQVDTSSGQVLATHELTSFMPSGGGAQVGTPAIYQNKTTNAVRVFIQTNAELVSIPIDPTSGLFDVDGIVIKPMNGTQLCGSALTIDETNGVLYLVSNYAVESYLISSFASTSSPLWFVQYPDPHPPFMSFCTPSPVSVDPRAGLVSFTFTCEQYGSNVVALDMNTGVILWNFLFPTGTTQSPIASTPLLHNAARAAFVSMAPYGLIVIDYNGTVITNGSYALSQASGTTPSLWIDSNTNSPYIIYQTMAAQQTYFELMATDLSGNMQEPWSIAATTHCLNDSKPTGYPVSSQTFVTSNNKLVAASTGVYDQVACVQVFDLNTGGDIASYQFPPSTTIPTSPFVDEVGTIYVLTSSTDFTATLTALKSTSNRYEKNPDEDSIHRHRRRHNKPKTTLFGEW